MTYPANDGPFQHTKNRSIVTIGGQLQEIPRVYKGDAGPEFRKSIPNATTNFEIDFPVILTQVVSIAIVASVDMTLKTNSSSSPVDTIALKAGIVRTYDIDSPELKFLGGVSNDTDITQFFVSNASGAAGDLVISLVLDVTTTD
jgi:hypothetical protein